MVSTWAASSSCGSIYSLRRWATAKACIGGDSSTDDLRELLVEQYGPFQSLLRRFVFVGSSFGKQGAVLEAGPSLLPQLGPATTTKPNSSLSPAGGGADQLLHDYIVHPSGEMSFAQGLAAYWALADCPAGAGGLVLLPGSHRAFVAAPPAVLDCGAADDLLLQPVLRAGDLLLCAGGLLQSSRAWTAANPQQLLRATFLSTTARVSNSSSLEGNPQYPPPPPIPEWAARLSAPELTALGWDSAGRSLRSDGEQTWVGAPEEPQIHPAVPSRAAPADAAVDAVEHYKW